MYRHTEILTYNPNFDFGAVYTKPIDNAQQKIFFQIFKIKLFSCNYIIKKYMKYYVFLYLWTKNADDKCISFFPKSVLEK